MNRVLFRWHRRIGITSAVFVLVLAVSGILLLLSSPLSLDTTNLRGNWVSKAYNLTPKSQILGVDMGNDNWVVSVDGLVYVGEKPPVSISSSLLTIGMQDEYIALYSENETIFVLTDGQIVERQPRIGELPEAKLIPVPQHIELQILKRYSGQGMPASRVILDIHTGRVFGTLGPWVMGLASVLLIALSLSGIIMWSTAGQRRNRREKRQLGLAEARSKS